MVKRDINLSIFCANEKYTSRVHKIDKHEFRSEFQRDRDRILYSKEFRRLSGKTQVFVTSFDEHMRTRLTHTLEVAQISDTIARKVGLNEVLVEAIAYGHDVGHTPFGHAAERTLNSIMNGCRDIYGYNQEFSQGEKGFKHNWQSLRVVTELEKISEKYDGLNLTRYTIWGILNHSSIKPKKCDFYTESNEHNCTSCRLNNRNINCPNHGILSIDFFNKYEKLLDDSLDWTVEGLVVAIADEIAQRHHDVEDAIVARIIDIRDIINEFLKSFDPFLKKREKERLEALLHNYDSKKNFTITLNTLSKIIVDFYVSWFIKKLESRLNRIINKFDLTSSTDFNRQKNNIYRYFQKSRYKNIINYFGFEFYKDKENFEECDKQFQQYLFGAILHSELAQSMDGKSDYIIRKLFKAYLSNPQQLPDNTVYKAYCNITNNADMDIKIFEARQKVINLLKRGDSKVNALMLRTVCDFIAGMTDQFAMSQFDKLYGIKEYKNY